MNLKKSKYERKHPEPKHYNEYIHYIEFLERTSAVQNTFEDQFIEFKKLLKQYNENKITFNEDDLGKVTSEDHPGWQFLMKANRIAWKLDKFFGDSKFMSKMRKKLAEGNKK